MRCQYKDRRNKIDFQETVRKEKSENKLTKDGRGNCTNRTKNGDRSFVRNVGTAT